MGLFDQFPYTNFHELNLDWVLRALKDLEHTIEQFVAINALKYANPIQWDITSQYEKNTIVIDPQSGTAYISVQPVPDGIALNNTDYWTPVFDLERLIYGANNNLTLRVEPSTTLNATFTTNTGEWVIWNGILYKALTNITAGDQYIVDSNIKRITVEEYIVDILTAISNIVSSVGDLSDLDTTDKSNVVAAINEIVSNLAAEVTARSNADGDLSDLNTTDKSNLVAAINEVNSTGGGAIAKIGDLNDLTTTDHSNLVAAINEVRGDMITSDTALDTRITALEGAKTIYYNVKDYGAVGDGVTDDTAAINTAVGLANTTGGLVFFPRGQYKVTDTIRLTRHGTGILGENSAGTYIFVHHNGPGVVIGDGVNTIPSISVQHIGIFNHGTTFPDASYGLFLNNVVNGFVSDVIVGNFKRCFGLNHAGNTYLYSCAAVSGVSAATGYFVYNQSVSSAMDNCIAAFTDNALDNGVGLALTSGDIADFSVKYFDVGNGGYGIYIDGADSPAAYPPADIRLYDCVLDGQRNACIYISNINQRGNVMINGGWLNPLAKQDNKCISIFNAHNIEVTNCCIQQLAESTPIIYGIFTNSAAYTTITNCRFINILGVYMQGSANAIINSNSFSGYAGITSGGYDIVTSGTQRVVINGNNSSSNMAGFVLQSAGDTRAIITNNIANNKSGTAISGTDASTIVDNNILS